MEAVSWLLRVTAPFALRDRQSLIPAKIGRSGRGLSFWNFAGVLLWGMLLYVPGDAAPIQDETACRERFAGVSEPSAGVILPERDPELDQRLRKAGLTLQPVPDSKENSLRLLRVLDEKSGDVGTRSGAVALIKRLSDQYRVEFYLPGKAESLSSKSQLTELTLSDSGKGLQVVFGRDFLENPSSVEASLRRMEELMADHLPPLPGIQSRVTYLNLSSGAVRRQLLGTEEAKSGPALWIRNRLQRHGVRVYVDDDAFLKRNASFLAYQKGTNVYVRSSVLKELSEERVAKLLGHELHHATAFAKCIKSNIQNGFDGCERMISFFADKGEGLFSSIRESEDLTSFAGYADFFGSDELEAYKISQNPKHASEMARRQLAWLKQLRQEIQDGKYDPMVPATTLDWLRQLKREVFEGKHDLTQPNPILQLKTPQGMVLKVGLPVDHKFSSPAEARDFYVRFIDKRIKGIEAISKKVDHPTGISQPHRTLIRKIWDRIFQEG